MDNKKNLFKDISKKHLYYILGGVLFLSIIAGSYLGFRWYSGIRMIPQVSGANFSLEYRKIPFDVKSIDIDFNVSLDNGSIEKNVTLSPLIPGKAELKNGNTISYVLDSKLKIGEQYTIYIKKDLKSANGVNIKNDVLITFEAISGAEVTKIIPSGELSNISQNLVVLFNIPVVSLTDLSSRDKLPCPLVITPSIEGKCKWTRPNVLEFEPKNHWEGATQYTIKVADVSGLLFPISKPFIEKVKTSELEFIISDTFSPKDGITISSNFPITSEELQKNMELTLGSVKIPLKVDNKNDSERIFAVFPANGAFEYSKSYSLKISSGLKPKYGNIPLRKDQIVNMTSIDFIVSIDVNQNILDASGAVIDTKSFYTNYNIGANIPTKNMFINLELGEDVLLNKNNFALIGQDGKEANFLIAYIKDQVYDAANPNLPPKMEDNRKKIRFTILDSLKYDLKYDLVIKKGILSSIDKDIRKGLKTTKELKLLDFKFLNNTQSCVYFTNDLYSSDDYSYIFNNADYNSGTITTLPSAKNKGIYSDKDGICPAFTGSVAHVFNTRFNPFTKYAIKIDKSLKDKYGNELGKDFIFNVTTGDIPMKDKYLYSSLSKDLNVIPSDLPIIVNLQSINLSKAKVQICEMDLSGYHDYMRFSYNQNYEPKCINTIDKDLDMKNKNWSLSNNKFDIEKDIAGAKLTSSIILIRATVDRFNMGNNDNGGGNLGYRDSQKEFLNVFIRENLSLTLEKSSGKDLIFASSFDGKVIPSDLTFESYDDNFNKLQTKAVFNKQKKVYEVENVGNLILAKNGSYFGLINKNYDQTSNYDFKYVSGVSSSTKDYLYVYTDRPLYKPKDIIYYKGLLRTFSPNGYHKSDISSGELEITDENGNLVRNIQITFDKNSNFNGNFRIPDDMPLGKYSFSFKPKDAKPDYMALVNGDFYIEEYKKPVFKVNLDAGDNSNYAFKDKVELNISPEYYFGGKMVNAKYFKTLLVQNYFFDAKDYSSYNFGNGYSNMECLYWGYCDYADNILESGEGMIGPSGNDKWSYDLPASQFDDNKTDLGEKIYNFNVTVEDPDTKKQISKVQSIILHDTDGYVGISASYWNTKKDGIKLDGVTLDHNAKPLPGKNVKIEIIKEDGKIVKKEGVDGIFYNDYQVEEKKEDEFNIKSDSKGEFSKTVITKGDGEYLIKATYTGKDGNSYTSSVSTYVSGDSFVYWNSGNNTVTDLVADKNLLKVGDTAGFTLKSPVKSGKAFITIEKDDGILDYFTQDIKSNGERILVPVKDSYYPNFYVKVYLIGKDSGNPLPIYKRALSLIKVNTDYKNLKVTIIPKKNRYLPGEKVSLKIKVTDENKKPIQEANGSISIVDESLLALKGNPKKFPYSFFYEMKRFLGVETFVSLMNLIEKLEVKNIADGEKGGAGEGEKGGLSKKKRGVFKDTAFWLADFKTDKNGEFNVTTDALPDNLTTWNIEALVSTPDDNKVGIGENTIVTTKKVILNDNLPRFFGSKDEIILSPVIFNKTGKDSDFNMTLKADNLTGEDNKKIFIKNGEQKTAYFKIRINDIGISGSESDFASKVNLKSVSIATGDSDEVERIIPIKETSIKETVAINGSISGGSATEKFDLGDNIKDTKMNIIFSSTLISSLFSSIGYLKDYPYGCIEQITSSIMPSVYLKELYDRSSIKSDLDKVFVKKWIDNEDGYADVSISNMIKDYLISMKKFQLLNGGFSYWQDSTYSDANFYLTSYIVDSVSHIRNIGFKSDEKIMINAISYLKNKFYENHVEGCRITRNEDCRYPESYRLKAINSILSYNKDDYEAFKMWKLIDMKDTEISTKIEKLIAISKIIKISSLTQIDKENLVKQGNDIIDNILNNSLSYNPRGAFISKDSSSSRLQNTSKFIEAIHLFGYKDLLKIAPITQNLISWTMSEKKDGSFGSTQDNIIVIKSIISFIEATGELKDTNMDFKISLNTEQFLSKKIDNSNKLEVFSKNLTGDKLQKSNTLDFSKVGNGKIYYDMTFSYFVSTDKVEARDEGFYLDQRYFDYAEYRKIEALKNKEFEEYLSGSIEYDKLKYPKEIVNYLVPIASGKVGQLVIAYNKIITPESRDKVAFEGFIPAGSELVNTNLSTENKSAGFTNFFERQEFRDDRFFAYVKSLDSGIYDFNYVLRLTHNGKFNIKPSNIFEFYNPEVFGKNEGRIFEIKQ
ncbi:MAG: MG2 domain-containing protein [Candidatus Gracilibacteria bacterium]|nr:MG2 domain-containing protein [Candidatus Gracilibacteria bacterium]